MSIYDRTRIPSAGEIAGNVVKELKKTAAGRQAIREYELALKARAERQEAADALIKQAGEWRQKARDGRVSGMDREVRELYVRKAEQAEREAERLKGNDAVSGIDLTRAMDAEAEAKRHDAKALDQTLPLDVRAYYRGRGREARERAARFRGETVETASHRS